MYYENTTNQERIKDDSVVKQSSKHRFDTMGTKFVKESQKTASKQAQNILYDTMNTKHGLSVYGYIRQNFERKCLIEGVITTILHFVKSKGGFLYVCGNIGWQWNTGNSENGEFFDKECEKPTCVKTVKEIVEIAAFQDHTMSIDYSGRVWAFGCGLDGRLGTGNRKNVEAPKQINLNQRAIAVSVGSDWSMILVENGNVLSCGGNSYGQLGRDVMEPNKNGCNYNTQYVPKIIKALKKHKIIQISAGQQHAAALSEKGVLFMWGHTGFGQSGVDQNKTHRIYAPKKVKIKGKVSMIECGIYHSLLITMSNLLYSFGNNTHGQLGDGTSCPNIRMHAMQKKHVPTLVASLKDVQIVNVAGGRNHTLCVDDEFNVWAFGSNEEGQCGSKSIQCQPIPKKIEYFTINQIKAKEVSASQLSSCVITQNNECFVFGKNDNYQIGLEEKTDHFVPTKLPLFVQKASMGSYHSAFISEYPDE